MTTEAAAADTLGQQLDGAPAEVVHSQIDSALIAELAVPPVSGATPWLGLRPQVTRDHGILILLTLALLFFLGVRIGRRGRAVEEAGGVPETTPGPGASPNQRRPEGRGATPPKPGTRPFALPPHVVAMLQRAQETEAGATAGEHPPEPATPPDNRTATARHSPDVTPNVDVWIGGRP